MNKDTSVEEIVVYTPLSLQSLALQECLINNVDLSILENKRHIFEIEKLQAVDLCSVSEFDDTINYSADDFFLYEKSYPLLATRRESYIFRRLRYKLAKVSKDKVNTWYERYQRILDRKCQYIRNEPIKFVLPKLIRSNTTFNRILYLNQVQFINERTFERKRRCRRYRAIDRVKRRIKFE